MSIKKLTVAAVAALGLTLGAYSASAGPMNEGAALPAAKAPGSFTLVFGHGGGGGGHGGGGGMGFSGGMGHGGMGFSGGMGSMGHSFGSMGHSYGSMGHSYGGMGVMHGPSVGHYYGGGMAGHGIYGGRSAFNGHRGYWRHGHFFPFYGVGLWDYGYGDGGGSCYWNCRSQGYGPGFCSANAYAFCY